MRFDARRNQTHRYRDDSPVRQDVTLLPRKEVEKYGGKGGGKDQDQFKSWWSRKNRPRGQGGSDQKISGKDKGKGKNIKGKGGKGKAQKGKGRGQK